MKQLSKLAAGLALAAGGLLFSAGASAAVICNNCAWAPGGDIWLGDHNPGNNDTSTLGRAGLAANSSFDDFWAFTMNPGGGNQVSSSFTFSFNISNFRLRVYDTVAPTTCLVQGAACASLTIGPTLLSDTTGPGLVNSNFLNLAAGTYAFRLSGDIGANTSNSYGGTLSTVRVPEPGSLALVALALIGGGLVARRRKSA